ncbi:hypothetical protein DMW20_11740 [Vibrio parahaemolyticus]|nr:hypothetical protein [Vibrio parahaemolyticus]
MNSRAESILKEIRQNTKKLNSCDVHKFHGEKLPFGNKYTCLKCGGEMKGHEVLWYITGYEAAGGDANDIYQGWHGDVTDENE